MTDTTDHAAAIARITERSMSIVNKYNDYAQIINIDSLRDIDRHASALAAELAAERVESERRKRHATNFAKEAQRAKDELKAERAKCNRIFRELLEMKVAHSAQDRQNVYNTAAAVLRGEIDPDSDLIDLPEEGEVTT